MSIAGLSSNTLPLGAEPSLQSARPGRSSGAFDAALREAMAPATDAETATVEKKPLDRATLDARWAERLKAQREVREDPERFRKAQEGAEQLVASTFIVPILQQLRETNNAAAPFGPGMYEKRMGPMLDAQIADRIVKAQNLPIVDAVRDRMLGVRPSRVDEPAAGKPNTDQGAV